MKMGQKEYSRHSSWHTQRLCAWRGSQSFEELKAAGVLRAQRMRREWGSTVMVHGRLASLLGATWEAITVLLAVAGMTWPHSSSRKSTLDAGWQLDKRGRNGLGSHLKD